MTTALIAVFFALTTAITVGGGIYYTKKGEKQ